MELRDAWEDLMLGSVCVGCGRPGRLLCPGCAAALAEAAVPRRPEPCPEGLVRPVAATTYDGTVRAMVLGLKERGLLALARPLGGLLALAVAEVVGPSRSDGTVLLVPVPSRPVSVRARGHDATGEIVRCAASALRRVGLETRVAPLLRTRPGLRDQAGLGAAERRANLHGSLRVDGAALGHTARRHPRAVVAHHDDVLTTGATAGEAQRALGAVGLGVAGVATVAATTRRWTGLP